MTELILGIDVGTTAVKAGLVDGRGRMVARFREAYPTHRPRPGWAEQDAEDWLRLVDGALAALAGGPDGGFAAKPPSPAAASHAGFAAKPGDAGAEPDGGFAAKPPEADRKPRDGFAAKPLDGDAEPREGFAAKPPKESAEPARGFASKPPRANPGTSRGFAAKPSVAAVGLCSQVNTHVFVGADDRPLMPAILWQDGRAVAEAAELDARVDEASRLRWWGAPLPIDASHPLARMLWVARHRPDVWDRTRWVMLPKDLCLLHLTGEAATDPVSNIGLVDAGLRPIAELLELVPGAAERLAPVVAPDAVAGRMRAGRPFAGAPVAAGAMDAWAGLAGAGGAREGRAVYLGGTSEILGVSSHSVHPTQGAVVFPEALGVRLHAAPTQSGGDAAAWAADALGLPLEAMSALVAATPRGPATPLFLPQLEGERAPLWDTGLRGAFLGLTRSTGRGDLARAVLEGVALSARHALETLDRSAGFRADTVSCGGGGFRSEPWTRIRADLLGRELRVLEAGEPGLLGAAAIAALGVGLYGDLAEAQGALAPVGRIVEPDPGMRGRADDLFGLYLDAVAANRDAGRRLAALHP